MQINSWHLSSTNPGTEPQLTQSHGQSANTYEGTHRSIKTTSQKSPRHVKFSDTRPTNDVSAWPGSYKKRAASPCLPWTCSQSTWCTYHSIGRGSTGADIWTLLSMLLSLMCPSFRTQHWGLNQFCMHHCSPLLSYLLVLALAPASPRPWLLQSILGHFVTCVLWEVQCLTWVNIRFGMKNLWLPMAILLREMSRWWITSNDSNLLISWL